MKELKIFEEHKFKPLLKYYNVTQTALARELNISQSSLNAMLNGFRPMREDVEAEIFELITSMRSKRKKKYHKIIRKKE